MHKRILTGGLMVFIASLGFVGAQTLDDAIKSAASEMSGKLPNGSTVAVVNFKSDSPRLTEYVIDELNGAIAIAGSLKPVERRRLSAIQDELKFNMSGDVSDESMQSIGQMLGAQNIVMGSIEIIGSVYRIRFQALSAETATIQYAFSQNIKSDSVLASLLKGTNALVDFTPGERFGTAGLNLVFGLGSFLIEGDKRGGTVTAILEGLGAVSFIAALALYNSDLDSLLTGNERHYNPFTNEEEVTKQPITKTNSAYPFYAGIGLFAGGAIFGIIRGFTYHKPGSQIAETPFDNMNIELAMLENNTTGLRFTYNLKF
ncbi:MAG: CsgG/HfaB family protein [Treponema sp.]|jgi:hypothetical protein|nr:CsgG/HfaB family protein [Treponema sp.]